MQMLALRLWAFTFLCSLVLSIITGAAVVQAQPVSLDLASCPEPREQEVRALAALELRGRLVEADALDAGPGEPLHILVSCTDTHAELRSRERAEVRTVDLGAVTAPLRARLLALSIAELARAHGEGEPVVAAASPPTLVPTVLSPQRAAAPAAESASRARAGAGGFITGGLELQALPLFGLAGALSSLVRLAKPLAWTAALSVGQTRRDIDRGRLRVRSLSLRSGPAFTWERKRALLHAGLAARLTLLELNGEPSDRRATRSARFRTFVIGPAAFAGLSIALGQHLLVACEAELAHQLRGVRAEVRGGAATELSPLRVALSLLAGARW
jgi:hypothetical protein